MCKEPYLKVFRLDHNLNSAHEYSCFQIGEHYEAILKAHPWAPVFVLSVFQKLAGLIVTAQLYSIHCGKVITVFGSNRLIHPKSTEQEIEYPESRLWLAMNIAKCGTKVGLTRGRLSRQPYFMNLSSLLLQSDCISLPREILPSEAAYKDDSGDYNGDVEWTSLLTLQALQPILVHDEVTRLEIGAQGNPGIIASGANCYFHDSCFELLESSPPSLILIHFRAPSPPEVETAVRLLWLPASFARWAFRLLIPKSNDDKMHILCVPKERDETEGQLVEFPMSWNDALAGLGKDDTISRPY